jgi:hypothetical protein
MTTRLIHHQLNIKKNLQQLHNIARWQADGNFDYSFLEKIPPKFPVQKRNGKKRRRETVYVSRAQAEKLKIKCYITN